MTTLSVPTQGQAVSSITPSPTSGPVLPASQSTRKASSDDLSVLVMASDLVVEADAFGLTSSRNSSPPVRDSASEENVASNAPQDLSDLEEFQVLQIQGFDRKGRQIVRIVGKFLPAPVIDGGRLKAYVLNSLCHGLQEGPFVIMYFHTAVQRADNSPGMLTLRHIYESLPQVMKQRLEAIYFVHPGFRSRLLLATVGRFFLSEGFYSKVVYISRLEFLFDHVKKGQIEVPEFVYAHDEELEIRPLMDYGLEMDPLQYSDMHGMGDIRSKFSIR